MGRPSGHTLLTIGDGIVTQVPALVIAVATGIIVTRSASDGNFSGEVARQITLFPKTLFLVCAGLFAMGRCRGFRLCPRWRWGITVFGLAWLARRAGRDAAPPQEEPEAAAAAQAGDPYEALTVEPVEIQAGAQLLPHVIGAAASRIASPCSATSMCWKWAWSFPPSRSGAARLGPDEYEILIHGVPAGRAWPWPAVGSRSTPPA